MSKVLIVTGETASGKTRAAWKWANENKGGVHDEVRLAGVIRDLRDGMNVAIVLSLPPDTEVEYLTAGRKGAE